MLAEKFILLVEARIKSNGYGYSDGSQRVVSSSPHIPMKLPSGEAGTRT
jgi:hypothetical protein